MLIFNLVNLIYSFITCLCLIAPGTQGHRPRNYTRDTGTQGKPQRTQRNRANGNHGRGKQKPKRWGRKGLNEHPPCVLNIVFLYGSWHVRRIITPQFCVSDVCRNPYNYVSLWCHGGRRYRHQFTQQVTLRTMPWRDVYMP